MKTFHWKVIVRGALCDTVWSTGSRRNPVVVGSLIALYPVCVWADGIELLSLPKQVTPMVRTQIVHIGSSLAD